MRLLECSHPDGVLHDCDYVEARNALVDPATLLAFRACKRDPRWAANDPALAGDDFVRAAHLRSIRSDIVTEKFHAAMDWLATKRGVARSTRVHTAADLAAFEDRTAPTEAEVARVVAKLGDMCCPHRGMDHVGNAAPEPGARCTMCDCAGWIPRKETGERGEGIKRREVAH